MHPKSPLHYKSADTLSVCGYLLKKGVPIIVPKEALDEKASSLAERGIIVMRDVDDKSVQLLRK